mmetsp:Transcript_37265/g.68168  ORF Transcript_37265/g.68168 Transcript_37265/m.68168 type:complete len:183 (+) Transcript_37265:337-885(+)
MAIEGEARWNEKLCVRSVPAQSCRAAAAVAVAARALAVVVAALAVAVAAGLASVSLAAATPLVQQLLAAAAAVGAAAAAAAGAASAVVSVASFQQELVLAPTMAMVDLLTVARSAPAGHDVGTVRAVPVPEQHESLQSVPPEHCAFVFCVRCAEFGLFLHAQEIGGKAEKLARPLVWRLLLG